MVSTSGFAPASSTVSPLAGGRDYYSIAQAANLLGVSRVSVWRWIRDGHLAASRVAPRTTRIRHVDLERLMIEGRTGGTRPWASEGPETGTVIPDGVAPNLTPADWRAIAPLEHVVQFYDVDETLLDAVAGYIGAALRAGDVGIIIATEAHRREIQERLRANGLDVNAARDRGDYVDLDAAGTLSRVMLDGMPDPVRFTEIVGSLVTHASGNGRRVRAFGEMVALLADEGNDGAAVRLEELWNDLQTRRSFTLFCAYPMASLGGSTLGDVLGEVCDQHAHVIPAESYTSLSTQDDRSRAIVRWQHKAQSLEKALAAERDARRAAEDALRVRDAFLSIASHEFKTPLTTLSGRVQIALRQIERDDRVEPQRVVRSLETIGKQTAKLLRLTNELLDVSRLEAGKLEIKQRHVDLTALVEQAVEVARLLGDRHTIVVSAPPSLEACVDPLRLEQVMNNLLDNAVKYSPDGGQIEVVVARLGADAVEIAVRDRGLGVPPGRRERLFERFYQAHSEGYRGGLGLGLHISRQLVELHGGTIRAEFPPDGGTRVVVHLPLQQTYA